MSEKKRKVLAIFLFVIIVFCIIGIVKPSKKTKATSIKTQTNIKKTEAQSETTLETSLVISTKEDKQNESSTLDSMSIVFLETVKNDVTNKWKLAKVTGNKSTEEYALDYYKQYFKEDNEVHAVVNFTLNTTARVTYTGGIINVSIYEHVNGEEQDAKKLFTGKKLEDYHIEVATGNIEQIE